MSLRLVRQVGDYGLSTKDEDCGRPGARRVCSHSPTFSEASHLEADLLEAGLLEAGLLEAGLLEGLCRCVLVSSTSLGFVTNGRKCVGSHAYTEYRHVAQSFALPICRRRPT